MTEERLIQPGDTLPGEDSGIPPTYSAGNLPDGGPIEAVKKGRTKFYGPVDGPFALVTREDTLQFNADWRGYVALDVNGFAYPCELTVFEGSYDVVGEGGDLTPAGGEKHPLTFTPDLDQLQEVDTALRRRALIIQYQAALEEALEACAAAGLIPSNIVEQEQDLIQPEPDAEPPAAVPSPGEGDDEELVQPEDEVPEEAEFDVEDVSTQVLIDVLSEDVEPEIAALIDKPTAEAHLRGRAQGGDDQAAEFIAGVDAAT